MERTITQTPFSEWLDGQLRERNMGVRTLARRMDPADPERARRALNRYLFSAAKPTNGYRSLIAQALEVDEDELPGNDDAEPG